MKKETNEICVVGLGYIGLPTILMLSSAGNNMVGVDLNEDLVENLSKGLLSFEEKDLLPLFKENYKKINFTTILPEASIFIVAVPTPFMIESKRVDATYIVNAVKQIVSVCLEDTIIVIESTVSPGTIEKFILPLVKMSSKKIDIVHAPERIIPGNMIYELVNNSRVIGGENEINLNYIKQIYSSFCKGEIYLTDIKTAEMTKVVENTFRDINIAYANELAKICREANMDVYKVIELANMHPRVKILNPGPGVGGHCISVDPWFLVGDFPESTHLIHAARLVNDRMPKYVLKRINEIMNDNNIKDFSRVGLYGLTYKADVDDTRESPTLQLLELLSQEDKERVKLFDPMVSKKYYTSQSMVFSDFINSVDLVVILVGHSHLIDKYDHIKKLIVFDTCNALKGINVYRL